MRFTTQLKTPLLEELIGHLKKSDVVMYHAPLDYRPLPVTVKQYTINNVDVTKSRATLWTPETKSFVVNLQEHLDRFRIPASTESGQ